MVSSATTIASNPTAQLAAEYARVRALTVSLSASLAPEDTVVQSMPDVSPTKWHLAHITWFFERFVLAPHAADYRDYDERFDFLFNSYYYTAGQMHARSERGLLSRPTLQEVLSYREHVDQAMLRLIESMRDDAAFAALVTLGLNHEQQHQELLLTDIKHVLSCNPLKPAAFPELPVAERGRVASLNFLPGQSGVHEFGADGDGFFFDRDAALPVPL